MRRSFSQEEYRQLAKNALDREPGKGLALPDGTFAWSMLQCLELFSSLESTDVVVLGGEFFRDDPIGIVPAGDGWTCEREPGETDAEYALRSRSEATYQIGMEGHADLYVLLELSDQGQG
jgi:hypothetical protein